MLFLNYHRILYFWKQNGTSDLIESFMSSLEIPPTTSHKETKGKEKHQHQESGKRETQFRDQNRMH